MKSKGLLKSCKYSLQNSRNGCLAASDVQEQRGTNAAKILNINQSGSCVVPLEALCMDGNCNWLSDKDFVTFSVAFSPIRRNRPEANRSGSKL